MTVDHIDRIVRQANPVPNPLALVPVEPSVLVGDDHRRTDMQTYDDIAHDGFEKASRRRGIVAAAIAAVAAVFVGAALVAWPTGDGGERASVAAPRGLAATEVAGSFLDALAGNDAEGAARLLGADALVRFDGLDGLRRETSWRESTGFELLPGACREDGRNEAGATVTCPYAFHGLRSEELGLGPYGGSNYLFLIRDGRIVSFSDTLEYTENRFAVEVWEPFALWLTATHPADVAVMYTTPGQNSYALTDASIELWEQRTREYVAVRASGSS